MDMGDAKHTPGPWKAVEPTAIDYRSMQIQTDESLIAVCCGGGPKRAISAPEERANARLIAAAPEMRDAIKEKLASDDAMLAFILNARPSELGEEEWGRQHKNRCDRGRAATQALRAALTKAGV